MFSFISKKFSGNQAKISKNVLWATTGKITNMVGALFVGILVARYLGPDDYGFMNYVISYVTLFSVLAAFGLDNIEIRELSKNNDNKEKILGTSLRLRLMFASLAQLILIITLLIGDFDNYTIVMILMYSFTLYMGCFSLIRNYFTSIIQNEYVVKSEIIAAVIGYTIKIALLWIKAPVGYFIAATMVDALFVMIGYLYSYKKIVGFFKWTFNREYSYYLIKESFPLLLSGAAVVIYSRIDQVMIGNMIDNASVGFFATAGKFLDVVLFIPMVLTQTVTPLIIQAKDSGDTDNYLKKRKQFVGIVVWISIILATFITISSHWLISYTYGSDYLPAVPVLSIMAWKTVGLGLSASAGQLIIMEGIQKWAFIKNLLGCVCCVFLNYLLLPVYGIVGSAIVTILTTLVAGWLGNIIIPPYHHIFRLETYALFCGWRELKYFKSIINRR